MRHYQWFGFIALVLSSACTPKPPSTRATTAAKTTDGALAVSNLQAQIVWHEKAVDKDAARRDDVATLISLYLMRGQYLGLISDYDRAEALAEKLIVAQPKWAEAYLARASVRSRLHLFHQAIADLDSAEKLGLAATLTCALRVAVAEAVGDFSRAEQLADTMVKQRPTLRAFGALAGIAADRGDAEAATHWFAEAKTHFVDVSPFPLATLELREGMMLQSLARHDEARLAFTTAHARLPTYAAAALYLAGELQNAADPKAARTLLEVVVKQSDDPEYEGALAGLLLAEGNKAEAEAMRETATRAYEALLARHREAFADHAARYFLGIGDRPSQALELAQHNLLLRPTPEAEQLVIDAAVAAKSSALACRTADHLVEEGGLTTARRTSVARAYFACQRSSQGEEQLRLAALTAPRP